MSARAAILDVDGTLVDSNDGHAKAWIEAFAEEGLVVDPERVRRSIGMGGDKLVPHVSGLSEDSPRGHRISERRSQIFKSQYLPAIRPFPGTRRLVERFARDGFVIAVASSAKQDELTPLLQAADVADLVRARTSSDDADASKPDPDIVVAALQRVGAKPADAVMLGDTPYDVEAAGRAGVAIVGLECGGWSSRELVGAVETYRDPSDLLAHYERTIFCRLASGGRDTPRG